VISNKTVQLFFLSILSTPCICLNIRCDGVKNFWVRTEHPLGSGDRSKLGYGSYDERKLPHVVYQPVRLSFQLFISSQPAVFFSHNKPANSTFSRLFLAKRTSFTFFYFSMGPIVRWAKSRFMGSVDMAIFVRINRLNHCVVPDNVGLC
jgi:hypothetical protein